MKSAIFNVTLILLFMSGIQSVLGQTNGETDGSAKLLPTQNFCFDIPKPGTGGCPVGENIPFGTPLLEAIRQRNIPEVKKLIAENANVNEADERGLVPLILVSGGDFELMDILIAAGANVNIEGLYGRTPLGTSTICSGAIKKLLEAGANVNQQNHNRQTALMLAAQNRNIESVKLLLDAGADIHVKDLDEMTPLLHAVKGGNLEITKLLYEKGGKKDLSDELTAAIALSIAVGNAQPEMVKFLLQTGINPNFRSKYRTAITTAAMRRSVEVVRLLIEAGADVNLYSANSQSPLGWASQYGYTEIVKLLLAAGANVNPKGNWSPLINAARNNQIETMEILLKAGANTDVRGYEGKTALMDASCMLKVEAVKLLIKSGADLNLIDDGETALSLARKCSLSNTDKQNEIIQMLITAGAVEQ